MPIDNSKYVMAKQGNPIMLNQQVYTLDYVAKSERTAGSKSPLHFQLLAKSNPEWKQTWANLCDSRCPQVLKYEGEACHWSSRISFHLSLHRLSYRTGQDTANCDTCRNSACIIYRWASCTVCTTHWINLKGVLTRLIWRSHALVSRKCKIKYTVCTTLHLEWFDWGRKSEEYWKC